VGIYVHLGSHNRCVEVDINDSKKMDSLVREGRDVVRLLREHVIQAEATERGTYSTPRSLLLRFAPFLITYVPRIEDTVRAQNDEPSTTSKRLLIEASAYTFTSIYGCLSLSLWLQCIITQQRKSKTNKGAAFYKILSYLWRVNKNTRGVHTKRDTSKTYLPP